MNKIQLDLKDLYRRFSKSQNRATELIKDQEKAKKTINEAFDKANANKADFQSIWGQFQLLFALAKDYFNGTYKNISTKSIIAIVAALLYFLSPIDLIPDFILGLGFIDDVFIIGLVIKQIAIDLEKYRLWKESLT